MSTIQPKQILTVYQPLWNLDNHSIFGYEARVRFSGGYFFNTVEMAFEAARENGELYELDTKSISNAISRFPLHLLNSELLLFIKIYSSTLLHPHFESLLSKLVNKYPQIQGKLVFTIEADSGTISEWKNKISWLKEKHIFVALAGGEKGITGLQKIMELAPDYIKLDREFLDESCRSDYKQQMISLLQEYTQQKLGVILEGIDDKKDLEMAKLLNILAGQGNLLGRPQKLTAKKTLFLPRLC
jgi:EAL domain-containing protein (putative c-di-GMP-specific phosphodiesterase class I)